MTRPDPFRERIGGITDTVHNRHNYAWHETHDGRDLWVVRKGAADLLRRHSG